MDTEQFLDRLAAAVRLDSDDVAIRVEAEYAPQAGPGAKVFPPTYIAAQDGTRYHFERRWDADGCATDVVLLDSVQSQANRAEVALRDAASSLGLPRLVMRAELEDRVVEVSSLDAPHRSRDAYFIDSTLDGVAFDKTDVGQALARAGTSDATAYLRYAPYDLVYGVWDSHRGKRIPTRFARSYTSEIVGWQPLRGKKAATKTDPLNLPPDQVPLKEWRPDLQTSNKAQKEEKLTELGHGMIPVAPGEPTGGVHVQRIVRTSVLSLTGLAALRFPVEGGDATVAGRVALAALGLLGDRLAYGRAGLNLRSGSDLVRSSERAEWVRGGDGAEPLALDADDARALLAGAVARLAEAGVRWDPDPVVVQPTPRLREVIERTFFVPVLEAGP